MCRGGSVNTKVDSHVERVRGMDVLDEEVRYELCENCIYGLIARHKVV